MDKFKQLIKDKLGALWNSIVRFWRRKHITQIILLAGLVVILLSILWFAFIASRANVQSLRDGLKQSTIIYDKDGDVAGKVATNRTEGITFEQLPDQVPNAVIAIEDERFREHNGFDIKGITRAFFGNLFAGRITGGGSTITQQLTKNALLSPERSYKRKIEELFLAVEIEKAYTKNEIIEMYLNQVYFGSGAWGISNASKKYFNKDIQEVTISEAALLAGLLQAPSALDPYNNYEKAMNRRDVVLGKMNELGMISNEEHKAALNEKIILEDGGGSIVDRKFPYYMDAVLDEAINEYGLTQEEILTRGYVIHTQLDQNLQADLERVYSNNANFPQGRGGQLVQSGAVLLDPKTGGVRALVGGRGEHVFRGFNRATHLKAQPGSTMKPLAVYTPALEEGYDYDSMLIDKEMTFGKYKPQNFSRTYQEEVPMYEAVEKSINVPAVWLLNEIGLEKGLESVKKFGIPLQEEDRNLAIALGGMHKGISPQDLAEAYSTFANGGKREESHIITKIVGPTGKIIDEHKDKTTRVTSRRVANEMTSMLLNVVETGTGRAANISGLQIAGKTGSTQLPYSDIDGTKDQWFAGYTPNIVGAVWIGYDKTDREHYLSSSSSETVVPIFREIMEEAAPHIEKTEFDVKSVNEKLGKYQTETEDSGEREITEKAKQLEEELKKTAEKVEERLKEEAPKWKEVLEEARRDASTLGDKLKEKIEEFAP
ncbi:PBP1A family penicillin-binding protein [Mesobacillus foraminis]|uniref:PBP1A family penicillin-binding protein n=1 Tax=Mesobacillus foraminis TaxID=279826 RepID=UPI001BED290A|nr:PBP1A family penicillin-binding protein [Mesobacillus foraminis]MBT2755442.1 PBP1A family penicillin-binding protein [Mesobacillus foraminis]